MKKRLVRGQALSAMPSYRRIQTLQEGCSSGAQEGWCKVRSHSSARPAGGGFSLRSLFHTQAPTFQFWCWFMAEPPRSRGHVGDCRPYFASPTKIRTPGECSGFPSQHKAAAKHQARKIMAIQMAKELRVSGNGPSCGK